MGGGVVGGAIGARQRRGDYRRDVEVAAAGPHDPQVRRLRRALGLETSESERRAADAERELIEWKKVSFMAQHVGDEFEALIISLIKQGFFVELTDLFVEGFVPLSNLERRFLRLSRTPARHHRPALEARLSPRGTNPRVPGPHRPVGK